MYSNGYGVQKNNVMAYMWSDIGATRGITLSEKKRAKLADQMAREDISKAEVMASMCIISDYKECGY